jgi:hypothetical protein
MSPIRRNLFIFDLLRKIQDLPLEPQPGSFDATIQG